MIRPSLRPVSPSWEAWACGRPLNTPTWPWHEFRRTAREIWDPPAGVGAYLDQKTASFKFDEKLHSELDGDADTGWRPTDKFEKQKKQMSAKKRVIRARRPGRESPDRRKFEDCKK